MAIFQYQLFDEPRFQGGLEEIFTTASTSQVDTPGKHIKLSQKASIGLNATRPPKPTPHHHRRESHESRHSSHPPLTSKISKVKTITINTIEV
jgi:hypothetical protein